MEVNGSKRKAEVCRPKHRG
jgi:hypothetical protein